MQAFSIRQLKSNPSTVLRAAEADAMALVTNHHQPTALVVALDRLGVPNTVAGLPLPRFLESLSSLKIPLVEGDEADLQDDLATGESLAAGWLTISDFGAEVRFQPLNPGDNAGGCSTISLALHWQATGERVLVNVDDRCGRAEARSQGVAIIGTAAVLVVAKERNLIPACGPLLLASVVSSRG